MLVLLVGRWGGYFSSFDAVVDPAMLEDFDVADDAVDHGSGHGDIAEALRPLGKRQVGCDDDGAMLVASEDEL